MAEKVKKEKGKVRKIIEWVFVIIFGAAALFVLAGTVSGMIHKKEHYNQSIRFGYGTFRVLTDSMEDEIKTGSMLITKAEDVTKFQERLNNNEVIDITFFNVGVATSVKPDNPIYTTETTPVGMPMTHRLREVHVQEGVEFGKGKYIFVASGINEKSEKYSPDQYQLFSEKEYLGTVKVSNAFLGSVVGFMSKPWGLIILLLIPAGYLIVTSSIDIFKAVKEEEDKAVANQPIEGERLSQLSEKDKQRLKDELLDEMLKSKKEGKK